MPVVSRFNKVFLHLLTGQAGLRYVVFLLWLDIHPKIQARRIWLIHLDDLIFFERWSSSDRPQRHRHSVLINFGIVFEIEAPTFFSNRLPFHGVLAAAADLRLPPPLLATSNLGASTIPIIIMMMKPFMKLVLGDGRGRVPRANNWRASKWVTLDILVILCFEKKRRGNQYLITLSELR
jgi:hypothetical protein